VLVPALERQLTPAHSVRLLSVFNVTDFGGEIVRQSVLVVALGPKLSSISQLMFFDGDKNSVPVGVCGTSVPDVCDVLDVVLAEELVVVVVVVTDEAAVVVDAEFEEDGLLEQAARARAHAGRSSSRSDHVRSARGTHGV
jgi:hypothetical protein